MPAATLRRSLVVSSEFTGFAIQSREPSALPTAASSCNPQACQIFRHGPGLDPHPRLLIKWRSGARRKQERPRTRSGSSLTKRRYWCQTRSAMILAAGPGLSKNVVSLATLLPQLHPDSNILRWICGAGIAALACQVDPLDRLGRVKRAARSQVLVRGRQVCVSGPMCFLIARFLRFS